MRRIWHISPLKIYNLEFESPVFVKTVKWHLFLVRKKRFLKNGGKRRYNEKNRGFPRFFVCHLLRTLILVEEGGYFAPLIFSTADAVPEKIRCSRLYGSKTAFFPAPNHAVFLLSAFLHTAKGAGSKDFF